MVRFLLVAALSIMMDGTALAADAARVQALDTVAGTYKPVKGTDNGDGTVTLATGSAPGAATTVKIKQPDSLSDGVKVDVGASATLLVAADPRTDHVIISGFDQTTATVWIGNSTVTTFVGLKPGDGIVPGSPPVVYTTSAAIYAIVTGPPTQTIVVKRVFHSVAP